MGKKRRRQASRGGGSNFSGLYGGRGGGAPVAKPPVPAEDEVTLQHPEPDLPRLGVRRYRLPRGNVGGLANLGNTCFFNSTLQCLASCEDLARYLLATSWDHVPAAPLKGCRSSRDSLMTAPCLHRLRTRRGGFGDADADDVLPSAEDALAIARAPELAIADGTAWPPHGEGRITAALRSTVSEMRSGQPLKHLESIPAKHRLVGRADGHAAAGGAEASSSAVEGAGSDPPPPKSTGRKRGGGPVGAGAVRPTSLLTAVGQDYPMFRGRAQQDAHELLMCLLNGVEEEESRRLRTRADRRLRLIAAGRAPGRCIDEEAAQSPVSAAKVLRAHAARLRRAGGEAGAEAASILEKDDGNDMGERVALTVGGRGGPPLGLGLRGMATKTCLTGAAAPLPAVLARALVACEAPRTPRPCTLVDDLFRGQFAQLSRCENCGNLHVTVQDWLALALPLCPPRARKKKPAAAGGARGSSSSPTGGPSIHLSKRDKARLRRENDRRRKEKRPILGPDFKELPAHRQPKGTRVESKSSGLGSRGLSRADAELSSVLGMPGSQIQFLRKGEGRGGRGPAARAAEETPESRKARALAAVRSIKPQPTESWLHFAKAKDKWSWLKQNAEGSVMDKHGINQPWKRLRKTHGGHTLDPIIQEVWQQLLREAGMLEGGGTEDSGPSDAASASEGATGSEQTEEATPAEPLAVQQAKKKAAEELARKQEEDGRTAAARKAAEGLLSDVKLVAADRWARWEAELVQRKKLAGAFLDNVLDSAAARVDKEPIPSSSGDTGDRGPLPTGEASRRALCADYLRLLQRAAAQRHSHEMRRLQGRLPELPGLRVPTTKPSAAGADKGVTRFGVEQALDLACAVERLRVADGNGYECPRCSRQAGSATSGEGGSGSESSDEEEEVAGGGKQAGGGPAPSPASSPVVHRNGSRRYVLLSTPPVLVLHAQRFRLSTMGALARYVKDDRQVGFPVRLDLRPWMLRDDVSQGSGEGGAPGERDAPGSAGEAGSTAGGEQGEAPGTTFKSASGRGILPTQYDLFGVVCHHGSTLSGGHYTAFVSCGSGWKHVSDASVSSATEQQVLSAQAYLLFYRRVDSKTAVSS